MRIRSSAAIVTGAASGLGHATAVHLASLGAAVVGIDLDSSLAQASTVSGVTYVAADVSRASEVSAAVVEAAALAPLRIVVNCAGIAPSQRVLSRGGRHSLTLFDDVVRVNLIGTFTLSWAVSLSMSPPFARTSRW